MSKVAVRLPASAADDATFILGALADTARREGVRLADEPNVTWRVVEDRFDAGVRMLIAEADVV